MLIDQQNDNREMSVGVEALVVAALATCWMLFRRLSNRSSSKPSSPSATTSKKKKNLNVVVVGAGAVGAVAGLCLTTASSSWNVVLVGRERIRRALQAQHGQLVIQEYYSRQRTRRTYSLEKDFKVAYDLSSKLLVDADVILVAVKTVDTLTIAKQLAELLPTTSDATVLSLQNGMQTGQILRSALSRTSHPAIQVLESVVTFPVSLDDEGVAHVSLPGGLWIQRPAKEDPQNNIHTQRVQALVDAWQQDGLLRASRVMSHLTDQKLIKFLINVAVNPVNALAGNTVPLLLQDRLYRRILAVAMKEAAVTLLLRSDDDNEKHVITVTWPARFLALYVLPWLMQHVPAILWRRILPLDRPYASSMLQDLQARHGRTEMDDFSGFVVRHAAAAPIHTRLCTLVETAAVERRGSPCLSSNELAQELGITMMSE